MHHILTLPDGRVIASGKAGAAIISASVTGCVNSADSLMPGAVCPAVLELSLFDDGTVSIAAGDLLKLSSDSGDDLGSFYARQVQRRDGILTVTGWDCLEKLDKDLTGWLQSLTGWPYRLEEFAGMVCAACGLTLITDNIPNGDYRVPAFSTGGITGRQLLGWAAQAAGRFCRAVGADGVEFAWYGELVTPEFTYLGSVTQGAPTDPIASVGIRRSEDDVGVRYPETGEDPLYITGNFLLTAEPEALTEVAQTLYQQLQGLSWVPCSFRTGTNIRPGDRVQLPQGIALAMEVQEAGGICTVRSFGPEDSRQDPVRSVYKALSGRVLELHTELEDVSLRLEETDAAVRSAAQLKVDVAAIQARVERTEETTQGLQSQASLLNQRADGLELSVINTAAALEGKADKEAVQAVAEHFRFDGDGLTITNSATGMGIGVSQERIVFTGGVSPTTVIYPNAMESTNLQVKSRLDLGDFSFLPRSNGNLSFRFTGDV